MDRRLKGVLIQAWGQWLVVLLFISAEFTLNRNMGFNNEVDVLPLARQFADPTWIPQDWYLNQPTGYRFLFAGVVGWMTMAWGFLAASIVGRLGCYALMAAGLVGMGRSLGLRLPFLLLAIACFLHSGLSPFVSSAEQGMAAKEWIVGSLEAKSVAYGLVLLAIASLLRGHERRTAALLGVATSFHVLVGGWAFLSGLGAWLWQHRQPWKARPHPLLLLSLYVGCAATAIPAVVSQLLTPTTATADGFSPSFIYVFLRLPHHLNPLSWGVDKWLRIAIFIGLFGLARWRLHRQCSLLSSGQNLACQRLSVWVSCSLVPFALGLMAMFFDTQGRVLQYYPFRLGDVMLPLGTVFLWAVLIQQALDAHPPAWWRPVSRGLLALGVVIPTALLIWNGSQLAHFPDKQQAADGEWRQVCEWVRQNTPAEAIVVTPPADVTVVNLPWMTQRGIVANYKFLPQTGPEIVAWYARLNDLSGGNLDTLAEDPNGLRRSSNTRRRIQERLQDGFFDLDTDAAIALMSRYHATYFLTEPEHSLALAIAYTSPNYRLYQAPPIVDLP